MKVKLVYVETASEHQRLGSAITVTGLTIGPDGTEAFADWCHGKAKFKAETPECYVTTGRVMNSLYGLTGDNAYPHGLNIVSFPLCAFERADRLVMGRFEVGASWLDDIIDNNAARER